MKDEPKKFKEDPADTAAREWLDVQLVRVDNKCANAILLSVMSAIIFCVGILIFLLPKPRMSEDENRVLADVPKFSLEALAEGKFTEDIAEFYSDRIPCRKTLIRIRSLTEMLALRGESGGVLLGSGGNLVDRLEYGEKNYQNITANFSSIDRFETVSGIETHVAIIPNCIHVMQGSLHPLFDAQRSQSVYGYIPNDALTFDDMLRGKAEEGEYVWYRTDHHYTTLGAYYVYCELGKTLGYTPYPIEFFEQVTVTEDFLGTDYSAAGLPAIKPDSITLFRYEGDGDYTVTFGNSEGVGLYDEKSLATKDKYSVFLGGNRPRVSVRLEGENRETLVVFKDSFSHAVAPFLALHFDLELIDLRYYTQSPLSLCREVGADRALVFCGVDTLATANDMRRLEMGLHS